MHQVYALILAAIASGIIYIEAPVGGASAVTTDCTITPAYRTGTTLTAPAFVHIECTATTHTDPDVRPFHDLRYVIDYNDDACASGSGAWTNSDSVALKNRDISPVGGHVYECDGTYTMAVQACDATGDCDTWTSASFTVQSEDAGYPTTATKCVAAVLPVAGSDGCPAGAAVQASADYDASLQTGAGTRTLYKCGETFTASASPTTTNATTNNSLIGSYGTQPCKATVEMSYSGLLHSPLSDAAFGGLTVSGWKVRDIIYQAPAGDAANEIWSIWDGGGTSNKVNMMFLRMEALGVYMCPVTGNAGIGANWNDRASMVSCRCVATSDGGNSYNMWPYSTSSRGLVIDNYWESTIDVAGWMRIYGHEYLFMAHNTHYAHGPAVKLTVQFRESFDVNNMDDAFIVFQDNLLQDDGVETYRTIVLARECGGTCGFADGHDMIIENNRLAYGASHARASVPETVMYIEKASDITVRNNIIDWRTFSGSAESVSAVGGNDGTYTTDRLHIYNNTILRAGSTAATAVACRSSGGTGGVCRNNLIYDVDDTDGSLITGSFALSGQNAHLNASDEGCPFYGASGACELTGVCASGISVDFDCFKLRTSGGGVGSVKDQGYTFPETTAGYADTVFLDAWGGCRGPSTGGPDTLWDIGAHEYGATTCY